MIVMTKHGNVEARAAIRETWGNVDFTDVKGRGKREDVKTHGSFANSKDMNVTESKGAKFTKNEAESEPEIMNNNNNIKNNNNNNNINNNKNTSPVIRTVFMFGLSSNPVLNAVVRQESKKHQDIIMEDFVDTYNNLTLKTMMGLKWVTYFCGNAQFVYKVDDDMFVNTGNLIRYLRQFMREAEREAQNQPATTEKVKTRPLYPLHAVTSRANVSSMATNMNPTTSSTIVASTMDNFVGGTKCKACAPFRNNSFKWFIEEAAYTDAHYPPFCFGPSYVMSMKAAKRIFAASKDVPFFHLEDVYTTGLVAAQKLAFPIISVFGMFNYRYQWDLCFFKMRLIASHQHTPDNIRNIWKQVAEVRCNSRTV